MTSTNTNQTATKWWVQLDECSPPAARWMTLAEACKLEATGLLVTVAPDFLPATPAGWQGVGTN